MTQEEQQNRNVALLTTLADPENDDPIQFVRADGKVVQFKQVATIPPDEDEKHILMYAILALADKVEGVGLDTDDGVVFTVEMSESGDVVLNVVLDDATINKVFKKYEELVKQAGGND